MPRTCCHNVGRPQIRAHASEVDPYPRTQKMRDGSTWVKPSAPTIFRRRAWVLRHRLQYIAKLRSVRAGLAGHVAPEFEQEQGLAAVIPEVLDVMQERPYLGRPARRR